MKIPRISQANFGFRTSKNRTLWGRLSEPGARSYSETDVASSEWSGDPELLELHRHRVARREDLAGRGVED